MKKFILNIIIVLFIFNIPFVYAKGEKVSVYVFTKENEDRSISAIEYLKELKNSEIGNYFNYTEYQIWNSNWQENARYRKLADKVAKEFKDEILGAPYIVIGQKYKLAAFADEYKAEIKNAIIEAYLDDDYHDVVMQINDEITQSKKYDFIPIIGIPAGILISITLFIYFSRRNLKHD